MKTSRIRANRIFSGAAILFGTAVVVAAVQVPLSGTQAAEGPRAVADRQAGDYDPDTTYTGVHDPKRIYRVVLGVQTWRANLRPERLRDVSCSEAKLALERKGTWFGRITAKGDCVNGDPTDWATGNYLNFLEQPRRHSMGL
jgi:hypothetical protein